MTYEEYRAGAIALAQSVDWGRPPRPGQPWPRRLMPVRQAKRILGYGIVMNPKSSKHKPIFDDYGSVSVVDDFQLRGYFDAKEKTQDREKLK